MTRYEVTEIGNGPWCDPIDAEDIAAAVEAVKKDLAGCHPVDYDNEWKDGDDHPRVKVTIREIETGEEVTHTLTVGGRE